MIDRTIGWRSLPLVARLPCHRYSPIVGDDATTLTTSRETDDLSPAKDQSDRYGRSKPTLPIGCTFVKSQPVVRSGVSEALRDRVTSRALSHRQLRMIADHAVARLVVQLVALTTRTSNRTMTYEQSYDDIRSAKCQSLISTATVDRSKPFRSVALAKSQTIVRSGNSSNELIFTIVYIRRKIMLIVLY